MPEGERRKIPDEKRRRDRLHDLVELARIYRGITKGEIARELGRDISKIYCESGNPKLDYVVALARVLDWSYDDVIDFVWGSAYATESPGQVSIARGAIEPTGPAALDAGLSARDFPEAAMEAYDRLVRECNEAMFAGRFDDMLQLAHRSLELANTPERRARAHNLVCLSWLSLGRYVQALEAVRLALAERGIPVGARLVLQMNLAFVYYQQWDLTSAYSISHTIVDRIESAGGYQNYSDCRYQVAYGLALRTRGDSSRRLLQVDREEALPRLEQAHRDLTAAARVFDEIALESEDLGYYAAYANTCRAGLRELEVELGRLEPKQALQRLFDTLPVEASVADWQYSAWIDSFAWVSIYAANIAQRHTSGAELQRWIGVLTTKAMEFADILNNWAIRERVFSLEYATNLTLRSQTGLDLDLAIDEDDMRLIAGTMGRYRHFHDVGLQIFQTAKIVRSQDRSSA